MIEIIQTHYPDPDKPGVYFCRMERMAEFPSQYTQPRNVDVWLPPGYDDQPEVRYPVIYMHDGQNVCEPYYVFGGVSWGMDKAMQRVMAEEGWPGVILVGLWHGDLRWRDYMPQQPLDAPEGAALRASFIQLNGGPALSDGYLRFLVDELKPLIDARYRSLPEREHTFVMGASMGGLVSLYAIAQYPQVFGGAGCVSTHWTAGGDELVDYLGAHLPDPASHRLYFDYGTLGLDSEYEPFQQRMDGHLLAAGYTPGENWLSLKFEGTDHSETSWRQRVHIPLKFLLG